MAHALRLDSRFDQLPRTPASDVKKLGWRGVMRAVGREARCWSPTTTSPKR